MDGKTVEDILLAILIIAAVFCVAAKCSYRYSLRHEVAKIADTVRKYTRLQKKLKQIYEKENQAQVQEGMLAGKERKLMTQLAGLRRLLDQHQAEEEMRIKSHEKPAI